MKKITLLCLLLISTIIAHSQSHELVYWTGENTSTTSYPQAGSELATEVSSATQNYSGLTVYNDGRNVWTNGNASTTVDATTTTYLEFVVTINTPVQFDRFVVHGVAPLSTSLQMQLRWDVDNYQSSLGEFTPGGSSYNLTSVDISGTSTVSSSSVTFRVYYYAAATNIFHSDTGPYTSLDGTPSSYSSYGRCFSIWGDQVCTPVYGTDTITECNSYTWIDGNTYTSSNDTATYTIVGGAANGCDSIVTLNLTIDSVSDLTTSTNGTTITSNNNEATYQWLDCNNDYAIIPGETTASYTANSNGSYAVELTENGCIDTTDCVTISTVGIKRLDDYIKILVYPNPITKDEVSISIEKTLTDVKLRLTDMQGKVISTKAYDTMSDVTLKMPYPAGVYFLRIISSEGETSIKLIKN